MVALILGLLEEGENSQQVVSSLTKAGYRVHAVDTFTKAVAIFEQPHEIDLIISDVHLENGGNVFDFLKWIRRNPLTSKIPFVLFSFKPKKLAQYLEDGVNTSARMLGADLYITMEHFDSDEFNKSIEALLPENKQVGAPEPKGESK